MDLPESLIGHFAAMFVGRQNSEQIVIVQVLMTSHAQPVLLEDQNGRIYNWSNIIWMKRVE